jgi:hypothetical protein
MRRVIECIRGWILGFCGSETVVIFYTYIDVLRRVLSGVL